MKNDKQKLLASLGGLSGAVYLILHHMPGTPEFLLGLLAGTGTVLMTVGLLPKDAWLKLRKWKRRGE